MDQAILQIVLALISGGVLKAFVDALFARWKYASGKKRSQQQLIYQYQAALAQNTRLAIEAGVDLKDLEPDPELLDKD